MVQSLISAPKVVSPNNETWDNWDTKTSTTVPHVPCPTDETHQLLDSVLSVEVSRFANYKSPENPETVNLLTWLTSSEYKHEVDIIRSNSDKEIRDRIKATLPAITPSGLFTHRKKSALILHSGLICLDIDAKGNEDITNYSNLKEELCHLANVAYCGRSVSGTGYFVLIPITSPEQHGNQFRALREIFQKRYSIRIDDTPDVSRLRGYSYDPEGYFNHQARSFSGVYTPPVVPARSNNPALKYMEEGLSNLALQRCVKLIENAQDGQKHTQLNRAAYLAGGYIAGDILPETETILALENAIDRKTNVNDLQAAYRTIQEGIRDGKQQPIYTASSIQYVQTCPVPEAGRETNGTPDNSINEPTSILQKVDEQLDSSSSLLLSKESQIELLIIEPCDHYPVDWDVPTSSGKRLTTSAKSFHEFQRQDKYFSQMGLASIQSP